MNDAKTYLLKIIQVVEPEEANEALAETLENLIYEEAVYVLLQTLPKSRRESVAKKWDENSENHAAQVSLLKHNFSEKQLVEAIEKCSFKAITDYLGSIEKTLDKNKKEKLESLVKEYSLEKLESPARAS